MSDIIYRQDAIDAADKIIERDTSGNNDVVKAMVAWKSYIEQLPSAESERKTGRWYNDIRYSGWTCTNCHYHDGNKTDRYCPNCGAKMEVECE